MRFTMLALGVLTLSVPAFAKESVDNPEFASWNKYKVGATVTLRASSGAGAAKTSTEMTHTLKSKAADKVVISSVTKTIVKIPGQGEKTIAAPAQDREIPAKLPKLTPPTAPDAPKPEVKTGEETLTVAGKSLKCKWTETTSKSAAGVVTAKIWSSDEVPGSMVKMTSTTKGGDVSVTTEMSVVSFKVP